METGEQYPITLVTAYFELGGKPGCPGRENPYPRWIRNFLPNARWPLVIFCDEQSLDMLREARGDKPAVYHVTRPEEFYAWRYLDDLKRQSFPAWEGTEFCIARSLVWHEKHHFLRQALSENPFGSEMLFWCDIGQFRHSSDAPWWPWQSALWKLLKWFILYEDIEWPNLEVCRSLPADKVILIRWPAIDGEDVGILSAKFFGGAVNSSRRWCDAYYRHLEEQRQSGDFTWIEEFAMRSCWLRRRELAHVIPHNFVLFRGNCGPDYTWHFLNGRRFPWKHFRLSFRWHFLNGGRFPWKYFCRRIFSG